jgi:uncharacterized protein YndB with AHSA1/START domain/DNA-binding transcriptional ArsR family regulator
MAVDELSATFAALADPTRRSILERLAGGEEVTVNELAEPFPMTLQAVSKHLRVLERAGLIERGRAAQQRPSRLRGAPLKDAADWLETYRHFWQEGFTRLDERLRAGEGVAVTDGPQAIRPRRHGITITRVFDAPRESVWKEWTEAERFADWFGGPQSEVPLASVSMDVRPGGAWRCTMFAGPDRHEIHWHGEYQEVHKPERLVFTLSDEPGGDLYELVTVVFTDLGDGRTEMHFQQHGYMEPDQYDRTEQGWNGFFDRIASRLADG